MKLCNKYKLWRLFDKSKDHLHWGEGGSNKASKLKIHPINDQNFFKQGFLMLLLFTLYKTENGNFCWDSLSWGERIILWRPITQVFLWHFCGRRLITCVVLITNTHPLPVVFIQCTIATLSNCDIPSSCEFLKFHNQYFSTRNMNGFELEFADEKGFKRIDNDNGGNVTSTANYFQYWPACHPAEPQTSQLVPSFEHNKGGT